MFPGQKNESISILSFPCKLHKMLEDAECLSFSHIVSWQPEGKSFKVNDLDAFEKIILKEYFNQSKHKSFQKQLNVYGFKRIQTGHKKGGYTHRLFSKQCPELCALMERKRPSTKGMFSNESFQSVNVVEPIKISTMETLPFIPSSKELHMNDLEVNTFFDIFFPPEQKEKDVISSESFLGDFMNEDIQVADLESTMGQGNMLDFLMDDKDCRQILSMLGEEEDEGSSTINNLCDSAHDALNTSSDEQNNFPWKLHLMLENSKTENYQDIVSWVGDGTAFKVHNCKAFVEKIMPNYFDQTKYESFRRQLNLYGFDRISKGADRGIISHPYLREGSRWLCANVTKKAKESLL